MADGSHIQWTDASWNFVTGCTKVSDGCTKCYIERTPPFRIGGRRFDKPGIGGTTGIALHEDRLTLPLRWRKPRRIFVNSLADLWHDEVPTNLIAQAFAVMVAAPHHSFQVLTKRHARMRSMLRSESFWLAVSDELGKLWHALPPAPLRYVPEWIWLGVSVESQEWAEPRLSALDDVPAAVRWVSAEPLLGSLKVLPWLLGGRVGWLVGGGESGPGARPCDPIWLRELRDDCEAAGTAFFCKQLGSVWAKENGADPKGGDWDRWPADLRIRNYPRVAVPA
jgi:protein gp37